MHRDSEGDASERDDVRSVTVRITRWDLLWLNLGVMSRWNGAWLGGLSAVIGAVLLQAWAQGMSGSGRGWLVLASAVLLTAAVASAAGCVVALGIMLVSSSDASVLGEHTYTFHDDGLREQAGDSNTLMRWGGVRDVHRRGNFILIHVAPGLYHALPRRSFGSPGEYQAFWRAAQRLTERETEALLLTGQRLSSPSSRS